MMMKELSSSDFMVPSFARGLNMLVVDNDTASLMYLASMLEQYSYRVTTTELAHVALSMISEEEDRFKLVIANVNMTDMDCFSFLRVLLKKEIPVVLMASERGLSSARKALAEGACFFLEKPLSFDDLKYIWQHVYKSRKNPSGGVETRKVEQKLSNQGRISQGIKIKEASGMSRTTVSTGDDLQYSTNYQHISTSYSKGKNKQILEVGDQKCIQDSWKQGGLKTKRSLDDDHGQRKRKEMKIILVSEGINYDNLKIFEELEKELMNDNNDQELAKEMNDNNYVSLGRKGSRRFIWTPELHLKFTAALSALENKKARPKLILKMMNVPHLTQRQIASHLQKYKAQVQRNATAANGRANSPSVSRPFSIHGSSAKVVQPHEKIKSSASTGPGRRSSDIEIGETNQFAIIMPRVCSSGNVAKERKSSADFIHGNQEVNAIPISTPPSSGSAPACSSNHSQPSPAYADLLKLLDEEEEEFTVSGNGLNPSDVERYYECLTEALLGDNNQLPQYFTQNKPIDECSLYR